MGHIEYRIRIQLGHIEYLSYEVGIRRDSFPTYCGYYAISSIYACTLIGL